jgi:hypothetical protein
LLCNFYRGCNYCTCTVQTSEIKTSWRTGGVHAQEAGGCHTHQVLARGAVHLMVALFKTKIIVKDSSLSKRGRSCFYLVSTVSH